jgi:hypothetical protein
VLGRLSVMNVHPTVSPATSTSMFDEIVCLKLETGWVYIESGEQALDCLANRFDDHTEPSWQRAHMTCSAFVAGQASAEAAKSTFVVAAMAAGIPFEVAEGLDVVERHVEDAASEGLITILFDGDEQDSGAQAQGDHGFRL